jgi:hypothetical protein
MIELDSTWLSQAEWNTALREQVPRRPSEYCESNVFVGASFLAPFEAARAVEEGYASQLLWGSDYPHIEGTWLYTDREDAEPVTRVAQRNTFCEIPPDATRAMLGENAVRVYGLDAQQLAAVAARIAAPSVPGSSRGEDRHHWSLRRIGDTPIRFLRSRKGNAWTTARTHLPTRPRSSS